MTQIAATEERQLHDYMNALSKETWATSNARLQQYVNEETHRPSERAPRLADKYRKNTADRLGFETNAHYTKDDLARSNPICTGDFETFVSLIF
jgi:hypothetical protein